MEEERNKLSLLVLYSVLRGSFQGVPRFYLLTKIQHLI